MNSKKLVLTGGPGGGKTTLVSSIKGLHREVDVIPEVATEVISLMKLVSLPSFEPDFSRPDNLLFLQRTTAMMQLVWEEQKEEVAQLNNSSWLVCDRGLADGAAYLTEGDLDAWCETLTELELTPDQVFSRYDMVIHLESLAFSSPEKYQEIAGNNPSRRESPEQAREVDEKIKRAWSGHPNWVLVPSRLDLTDKLNFVSQIVKGG